MNKIKYECSGEQQPYTTKFPNKTHQHPNKVSETQDDKQGNVYSSVKYKPTSLYYCLFQRLTIES